MLNKLKSVFQSVRLVVPLFAILLLMILPRPADSVSDTHSPAIRNTAPATASHNSLDLVAISQMMQ
jgi:hypothetical protein